MSPRIAYKEKRFSTKVRLAIEQADGIIEEYRAQGYQLSLRQLYYQFVARGLLPNTLRSYKNLGTWISDARLAGLIDWHAIEDRTRNLLSNNHWDDPEDLLLWASESYGFDTWIDQPERVEVWVEKEALAGVIERPARAWDVAWFACIGYTSQSELWSAAMRLAAYRRRGQEPTIIHLGDHDPSGIDMTRDIIERLELFIGPVNVERIALNMDQVEELHPPPNPAKVGDSRFESYLAQYGAESWELDALDPAYLDRITSAAIERHVDLDRLQAARAQQEEERARLRQIAEEWRAGA